MPKTPRLREWRIRVALSQEELAERSGISRATIASLESGNRDSHPKTVRRLADALGVAPEDLYGEAAPKVQAPFAQKWLFNNGDTAERRAAVDFGAFASALDRFSGYWAVAVAERRSLDKQQFIDFVESVRAIVHMVVELSRLEQEQLGVRGRAARAQSVLWPAVESFVAVAEGVSDLAEDRDEAASALAGVLDPVAA